jgi:TctA family transporter
MIELPSWQSLGLRFGPAELCALMLLALAIITALAPGPLIKALGMAVLGLLLGTVWGVDATSGLQRQLPGLAIDEDTNLVGALLLFGYLVPLLARHALRASCRPSLTLGHIAYHGVFLHECLPALLALRQRWLPPRWVLPLVAAWGSLLWVYFGLSADEAALYALIAAGGLLAQQAGAAWPPLVVGAGLSAPLEENLRRALLLSHGDWGTFAARPTAATLVLLAVGAVLASALVRARRRPRPGADRATMDATA